MLRQEDQPLGQISIRILPNYFDRSKKKHIMVPWEPNLSIQGYKDKYLPSDLVFVSSMNGRVIADDQLHRVYPHPGHELVFLNLPEDGRTFTQVLTMIGMGLALLGGPSTAWLAPVIGAVGTLASALLFPTKVPHNNGANSPTVYTWQPSTTQQQGIPVPRWYGTNRLYGNIVLSSTKVYTDAEGDKQMLRMLIDMGIGPFYRFYDDEFIINDQPATNFGVIVRSLTRPDMQGIDYRIGDMRQTVIAGMNTAPIEYPKSTVVYNGYNADGTGNVFNYTYFLSSTRGVTWDDGEASGAGVFNGDWVTTSRAEVWAVISSTKTLAVTVEESNDQVTVTTTTTVDVTSATPQTVHVTSPYMRFKLVANCNYAQSVNIYVYDSDPTSLEEDNILYVQTEGDSFDSLEVDVTYQEGIWAVDEDGYFTHWGCFDIYYAKDIPGQDEKTLTYTLVEVDTDSGGNSVTFYREDIRTSPLIVTRYITPDSKGTYWLKIKNNCPAHTNGKPDSSYSWGEKMTLTAVREIYNRDFSYPRHCYVGVQILATGVLSGSLRFSALADCLRVRIYDGANWTVEFSNNPAWVALDILTQPVYDNNYWVLRCDGVADITEFDIDSFLECAEYCDEIVYGSQKRVTYNGGFAEETDPWTAAAHVLSLARSRIIHNGTKYAVVIDKARSSSQMITMADMRPGSYKKVWLPLTSRASMIEGQNFIDSTNNDYTRQPIAYYANLSSTTKHVTTSVDLAGITDWHEAWRILKYHWAYNKYLLCKHEFVVDSEAMTSGIGEVIDLQDEMTPTGYAGKVVSGTINTITFDQSVTIEAGYTYKVQVRHSIDGSREELTVTSTAGTYTTVSVSGAFFVTPARHDVYAFGKQNVYLRQVQITGKETDTNQTTRIYALDYNASIYAMDYDPNYIPDNTNYSLDFNDLPVVENVTATALAGGTLLGAKVTRIIISWTLPTTVKRVDNGDGTYTVLDNLSQSMYAGAEVWVARLASDGSGRRTMWESAGYIASPASKTIYFTGDIDTFQFVVATVNVAGRRMDPNVALSLTSPPTATVTTTADTGSIISIIGDTSLFQIDGSGNMTSGSTDSASFHADAAGNVWYGSATTADDPTFHMEDGLATFGSVANTKYMRYNVDTGELLVYGVTAKTGHFETVTLGKDTVASGTLILELKDGSGSTYIAAGKTKFDNTETGVIIGLNDDDAHNYPMVFIGEPTKYFNYDPVNGLKIKGDITATSGHFKDVYLGKTAEFSGSLRLEICDGSGDTYIASGKTDFTNTETGFILGLDDSDSNRVKFYLGDSTKYLNYEPINGLIVQGTVYATSGNFYNTLYLGKSGTDSGILTLIRGGAGATYINSGKTAFSTTTNGFILGIDTDNLTKLYLGDSTQYMYWNGTNFYATGVLSQLSGTIGGITTGWIVTTENIKDQSGKVGLSSTGSSDSSIRIWAGNATSSSAPFRVTQAGVVYATNAYITGEINASSGNFYNALYLGKVGEASGTLTLIRGASGATYINSGKTVFTTTQDGFIIGVDTDNVAKFFLGNSTKYIYWDGTDLTLSGAVWAGGSSFNGTISDSFTLNSDLTDTNVQLIFGRLTGGSATFLWNGSALSLDKKLTIDHIGEKSTSHGIVFDNAISTDTINEVTSSHGVIINGVTLKGGFYTFSLTNGTASLDVATGVTVDFNSNLTVSGASYLDQDLRTTANPTFNSVITALLKAPSSSLVLRPTSDATTAIQVQDKDSNYIISVDTVNNRTGFNNNNPRTTVDIFNTGAAQLRLTYQDNALYSDFTVNSSGYLNIYASNGRVAIGVASPLEYFHVGGATKIDGSLTFTGAQSISTTINNLTLSPAADLTLSPGGGDVLVTWGSGKSLTSSDYVSQTTGWGINYGTSGGHADFRSMYADELHVKAFIADTYMANVGAIVVSKSRGKLSRNFTVPTSYYGTSTLYLEDLEGLPDLAVFTSGDYVKLRIMDTSGGGLLVTDVWGTVTSYSNLSGGEQSWTFTCISGYGASRTVYKGSIALDYGQASSGSRGTWEATVLDSAGSPYSQVATWATNPWTAGNWTTRVRLGNLDGIAGIGLEYGLWAGQDTTTKYMLLSDSHFEIHGLSLTLHDGANTSIVLDPTALSFALGTTVPTAYATGDGIWMGKDSGSYKFRVGDVDGERLEWDASDLYIKSDNNNYIKMGGSTVGISMYSAGVQNVNLTNAGVLTLGPTSGNNTVVQSSSIQLKNASTVYADLTGSTLTLGLSSDNNVQISSGHIYMRVGTTVWTDIAASSILVGQSSAGQSNVYISGGSLDLRYGTTSRIHLDATGTGYLASGNISWTAAGVLKIGNWSISSTSLYTGTEDFSGYTANAGDITIYSNGSDASIHGNKFYIDTTGTLYATGAYIDGYLYSSYFKSSSIYTKGTHLTVSVGAGTGTITVQDNSDFPSSGTAYIIDSSGSDSSSDRDTFTYTGKSGTTQLTGCSGVNTHLVSSTNRPLVVPSVQTILISDAVNEIRFFGNIGSGTVDQIASIGVTADGTDYTVLKLGSSSSGSTIVPIIARTYDRNVVILQNWSSSYATLKATQSLAGGAPAIYGRASTSASSGSIYALGESTGAALYATNTSTGYGIYCNSTSGTALCVNGTSYTTGRVGIGVTPSSTIYLRVHGIPVTDGICSIIGSFVDASTSIYSSPISGIAFSTKYTSGGDLATMGGINVGKKNTTSGNLDSYMSLITRSNASGLRESVRITSDGYVGIGVTAPTYQLELQLDSAAKPSTTLWTTTSSEKLKRNVELADLDRCWEIVELTPLKVWEWPEDIYTTDQVRDRKCIGWVAEDVQKVFPKAVNSRTFKKPTRTLVGYEEYEEQATEIKTRTFTEDSVQLKDGKAVKSSNLVKIDEEVLAFDEYPVFDENGDIVTKEVDGELIQEVHKVPRMIKKTREVYENDVVEDCLDLNGSQLLMAQYGALQKAMGIIKSQEATIKSLLDRVEKLEKNKN